MLFKPTQDCEVLAVNGAHGLTWWESRRWVRPWVQHCRERAQPLPTQVTEPWRLFSLTLQEAGAQGHMIRKWQIKSDLTWRWTLPSSELLPSGLFPHLPLEGQLRKKAMA